MIYNPFLKYTIISNYIDDFRITLSGNADYTVECSIDITTTNTGITFTVFRGISAITKKISKEFSSEGLINYSDECIFLSMRKPPTTGVWQKLGINPCVVEFLGDSTKGSTIQTNIFVKKPLNCVKSQNKLTLELLADNNIEYTELAGLMRINGKGPDSNGNLNIISKSPEVTVEVKNELSSVSKDT